MQPRQGGKGRQLLQLQCQISLASHHGLLDPPPQGYELCARYVSLVLEDPCGHSALFSLSFIWARKKQQNPQATRPASSNPELSSAVAVLHPAELAIRSLVVQLSLFPAGNFCRYFRNKHASEYSMNSFSSIPLLKHPSSQRHLAVYSTPTDTLTQKVHG